MTIEHDFRTALTAAGLPEDATLDDLLEHHRGVTLGDNEMLLRVSVEMEYEDADWESGQGGGWYASGRDLSIVADTLDARTAALLAFETEGGDTFPDGFGTLDQQIRDRFAEQREACLSDRAKTDGLLITPGA